MEDLPYFVKVLKSPRAKLICTQHTVAYSLSLTHACFKVPKVVQLRENNFYTQYVDDLKSVKELIYELDGETKVKINKIAAEILVAVHSIELSSTRYPISFLTSERGFTFIHGDFSLGNLHYSTTEDAFYVLDWESPKWLDEYVNCGSPSWDICMWIFDYSHKSRFIDVIRGNTSQSLQCFLDTYEENGDLPKAFKEDYFRILKLFLLSRLKVRGGLKGIVSLCIVQLQIRRRLLDVQQ